MTIPMVDLKEHYSQMQVEIEDQVQQTLRDGSYVLGPNVSAFEQEAAQYLGVPYTVAVNSGTDALHLALRALGVGPGDEVIAPSFTFIATIEAILYCGATPVFVDIDPDDFNLAVDQVSALVTSKTKAIIVVHLYGHPVAMQSLIDLAQQHEIKLVEDCAQSFGATWNQQQTGSIGDAGCFSFYPTKNLSCCGDGGLISCRDEAVYQELIALRNHGSHQRYHHYRLGYNSRLDEIQAAILRVRLRYIDRFNESRFQVAQAYSERLRGVVCVPHIRAGNVKHVFHQYTVLSDRRDYLHEKLNNHDIASAIYYPVPVHLQVLFDGVYDTLALPVTNRISAQCLSLPIYPEMSANKVDKVADVILGSL
jgi:dTDP-4-amino-4,6-dideoxygalactose transaminase